MGASAHVGCQPGFDVLMPSTPSAYPQVISRNLASFRVVKLSVSAGHKAFCDGFDSRQLHQISLVRRYWWGVARGARLPHRRFTRTRATLAKSVAHPTGYFVRAGWGLSDTTPTVEVPVKLDQGTCDGDTKGSPDLSDGPNVRQLPGRDFGAAPMGRRQRILGWTGTPSAEPEVVRKRLPARSERGQPNPVASRRHHPAARGLGDTRFATRGGDVGGRS